MQTTRIAVPVGSLRLPQSVTDLAAYIDRLSKEREGELYVRQYGSHIVVFTEGELCGCRECLARIDSVIESFYSVASQGMVICFSCGNKRCPHAHSHRYQCSGSNESEQNPVLRPEYQNGNAAQ